MSEQWNEVKCNEECVVPTRTELPNAAAAVLRLRTRWMELGALDNVRQKVISGHCEVSSKYTWEASHQEALLDYVEFR